MPRECTNCKELKDEGEFYLDLRRRSGFFAECKKCNNARSNNWYVNNYPDKRHEYVDRVNRNRKAKPKDQLLRGAKSRAKIKGIKFSITVNDIDWSEICPVFGFPMTYGGNGKKTPDRNAASLDRVDNSLGYVPGNVIVISHRANALKRDASLEELEALVKWLKSVGNDT
jgi:hypothetical protein